METGLVAGLGAGRAPVTILGCDSCIGLQSLLGIAAISNALSLPDHLKEHHCAGVRRNWIQDATEILQEPGSTGRCRAESQPPKNQP